MDGAFPFSILANELGHHPDVGHEKGQTLGTDGLEGVDPLEFQVVGGEKPCPLSAQPDHQTDQTFALGETKSGQTEW